MRTRESSIKRQRCSGCFSQADFAALCGTCSSSARVEDALALGTALMSGRYVFGLPLGSPGGFGITYHGWDIQLDRRVAIKEFFPRDIACRNSNKETITAIRSESHGNLQKQLDGFLDEARRAARIEHDHVVRILDFTEDNGTGYIVMPFYEGETLHEFRVKQPNQRVDWKQAVNLMFPILSALDAVHEMEMIHRDVKPSNIYLARTRQGLPRPILIDFGSARVVTSSRGLTGILTQGYAPLEQYDPSGKGQGPWSDLYAAAATLHELISGEVPPSAPARQLGRGLVDFRSLSIVVPQEFQTVLARALKLEPEERTQTADEFIRAIAATTGLTPTQRRREGSPLRKRSPLPGAILAIVGGVAMASAATWWATADSRTDNRSDTAIQQTSAPTRSRTANREEMAGAQNQSIQTDAGSTRLRDSVNDLNRNAKEAARIKAREQTARRLRATELRDAGDYLGAWKVVDAADDTEIRKSIANACRADSVISARRNAVVQCPPAIVQ